MTYKHSSESSEHYTPENVVEFARSILTRIDLDPATTEIVNSKRVRAANYFTAENDALSRQWHGRVFLNPPGGRAPKGSVSQSLAACFWRHLVGEWLAARVYSAFFVAFNIETLRTTVSMDIPAIRFPMFFPAKRVAFDRRGYPKGSSALGFVRGDNPPHSTAFVWIPPRHVSSLSEIFDTLIKKAELYDLPGVPVVPHDWPKTRKANFLYDCGETGVSSEEPAHIQEGREAAEENARASLGLLPLDLEDL